MSILNKIKTKAYPYIENIFFAKRFTFVPWKINLLLVGTPEYNNVGDSILTLATLKLFSDYLDNCNIIEVTKSEYDRYKNTIKRCLSKRDVITFQPGGNMGNVWYIEEICRRDVIQSFPNNKIILLPQTIYYEGTTQGQASLKNSQKIYSAHNDLTIIAREKISYQLMREYYPKNKVMLTPDMALYLDNQNTNFERNGVRLCLRNDGEQQRTESDDEKIIQALGNREYVYMDMYSQTDPTPEIRELIVKEKINEFTKAELVITDRLHGMICCALTETPCVVLSNNHHKIKGVYDWLKGLQYIEYVEDVNEVPEAIKKVMSAKERRYDNKKFVPYFKQIINAIKGK